VAAQDLDADRVEGAEPRHALDGAPDEHADALLHLARRLVGEGDGQDLARIGAVGREDMGDAGGQHARLAGAGAGQHQHGTVERLDRLALFRIEAGEIVGNAAALVAGGHGAGGDAQPTWSRGSGRRGGRLRRAAGFRLLVEERNIVETVTHAANVVIRTRKARKDVLLSFQSRRIGGQKAGETPLSFRCRLPMSAACSGRRR